jgi:hypothetical protein
MSKNKNANKKTKATRRALIGHCRTCNGLETSWRVALRAASCSKARAVTQIVAGAVSGSPTSDIAAMAKSNDRESLVHRTNQEPLR